MNSVTKYTINPFEAQKFCHPACLLQEKLKLMKNKQWKPRYYEHSTYIKKYTDIIYSRPIIGNVNYLKNTLNEYSNWILGIA